MVLAPFDQAQQLYTRTERGWRYLLNPLDANFWTELIKTQGLAIALVVWFIALTTYIVIRFSNMFSVRMWPWITEVYFPAQEQRRMELNNTLILLSNAVANNTTNLTTMQLTLQATLKSIEEHDTWERSVFDIRYQAAKPSQQRKRSPAKKAKAA